MKKNRLWPSLMLMLAFAAMTGCGNASTPSATAGKFIKAVASNNAGGIKSCCTPESGELAVKLYDLLGKEARQEFGKYKIEREEISDTEATVVLKSPDGSRHQDIFLTKSGKKWLVVIKSQGGNATLRENEHQYYKSQPFVAGKYIKNNFPGKKVLLLLEPGFEKEPLTRLFVDALKEGAGKGLEVVSATLDSVKLPDNGMPFLEATTAADFDRALEIHKDCGVVVSTIGLPRNAARMKAWSNNARPKFILLGQTLPPIPGLDAMVERDMISAVAAVRPDAVFDDKTPPRDMQAAFDLRYVLIDRNNIAKYKHQLAY